MPDANAAGPEVVADGGGGAADVAEMAVDGLIMLGDADASRGLRGAIRVGHCVFVRVCVCVRAVIK